MKNITPLIHTDIPVAIADNSPETIADDFQQAIAVENAKNQKEDECIGRWLMNQKSQRTIDSYQRYLLMFKDYLGKPLFTATVDDIERYLLWLRNSDLKPSTLNLRLNAIKSFYKYCWRLRKIEQNPADRLSPNFLKISQSKRQVEVLKKVIDHELLMEIINDLRGKQDYQSQLQLKVLATLYFTAFRVSELVNIRREDFQFYRGKWLLSTIGKGDRGRTIEIPPILVDIYSELAIDLHNLEDPYLFCSYRVSQKSAIGEYKPFSRQYINKIIGQIASKYGLDPKTSPHWTRHSHASNCRQKGLDMRSIQLQLGHASPNTTQIYDHSNKVGRTGNFLN